MNRLLISCCTLLFAGSTYITPLYSQISPWTRLATPSPPIPDLRAAWFLNRDTGFVCGSAGSPQTGKLYRTTNAGASWTAVTLPGSTTVINDIDFDPISRWGVIAGSGGYVAVTTNMGLTWIDRSSSLATAITSAGDLNGVRVQGTSNAYVVGDGIFGSGPRFARTSDRGISWQRIPLPSPTNNLYDVSFFDTLRGIAAGTGRPPRASRTTNAGTTWSLLDSLGNVASTSLSFYSLDVLTGSGTAYVAGGKVTPPGVPYPEVRRTQDFGSTWSVTSLGSSGGYTFPVNGVLVLNAQTALASARGGRIFITTDGGTTWQLESLPTSFGVPELRRFSSLPDKRFHVVGSGGTILRYEPVPAVSFAEDSIALRICPGQTVDGSFTVGNTGSGILVIDSLTVSNSAGTQFEYTFPSPDGVRSGDSTTSTILCSAPLLLAPGLYHDTLQVYCNDGNYSGQNALRRIPVTIMVNTKGVIANLPLPADGGRTRVGFTLDVTLTNVLRNPYDCATTITSVRFASGTEFSLQAPITGKLINPGGLFSIPIYFTPSGVCLRRDTVIVEHDGPASPLRIPVVGTGIEPSFRTEPSDTLDFGNVPINNPTDRILTMRNDKPGGCLDSTRISRFRILPSSPDFTTSFSLSSPVHIQPDDSIALTITARPSSTGIKTARVLIDHEILGGSRTDTVILIANAVEPALTPLRNQIVFGPTDPGGWRDSSVVRFLRNLSGIDVQIVNITITGGNASEFIYRGPTTFPVPADSSRTIDVTFKPVGSGAKSAVLEITTDIPSTIAITLSGSSEAARIGTRRNQVVFPEPTAVNGCKDTVLTRYLINSGKVPLRLRNFRIKAVPPSTDADALAFTVVDPVIPPDSLIIAPGDSAMLTLQFCPKRPGTHEARLEIESNADTVVGVLLLATGQAARVVREELIAFASTRVLTSRDTTFAGLIFNDQSARLDIQSMNIAGADALSFEILHPTAPFSLSGDRDTAVSVRFRPLRRGRHVATLLLKTSHGDVGVTLQGEATFPFLEVRTDPVSLRVRVNTSRRIRIDIVNAGDDSARIENAFILGSAAFTNATTGTFPVQLQAGESIPLFVDFMPDNLCQHNAKIQLRGEGIRGSYTIADTSMNVAGVGVAPFIRSRRSDINFGSRLLNSNNDSTLTDFLGNVDFSGIMNDCIVSTTIDSLVISGPGSVHFQLLQPVDPLVTRTIDPITFQNISIRYKPLTYGRHSATLRVYFDGHRDSILDVQLNGASTLLPLEFGPVKDMIDLDFGGVTVGGKLDSVFTAKNISTAPLTIDAVSISGGMPFEFIAPPVIPFVMEPGVSIEFRVRFSPPTNPSRYQTIVAFTGNGLVDSSFALRGRGVVDQLRSASDTLNFGIVAIGSSTDSILTLLNRTTSTVADPALLDTARVRAELLEGSPDYQLVAYPLIVGPSSTDKLLVRFAPGGQRGLRQGRIRIYHNVLERSSDLARDSFDVILLGNAEGDALPIHIDLGSRIDTQPGTLVEMPVRLSGDLLTAGITQLSLHLKYRRTSLRPVRATATTSGLSIALDTTNQGVSGKDGRLGLAITATDLLPLGEVTTIQWLVLLGDALESVVAVDSIEVLSATNVALTVDSATISIAQFCNAQRRLIRFDSPPSIKAIPHAIDGTIDIDFALPAQAEVLIGVYDLLGHERQRVLYEEMMPGRYSRTVDISHLSDGTYYCVMVAGTHIQVALTQIVR